MVKVHVEGQKEVSVAQRAPTLAERIKADANRIEYEVDTSGRRIGARKLTFLDMYEITLAMGQDAANQAALQQAMMIASVVEIDGEMIPRPATSLEIKALMKRLDFHGLGAVTKAMGRFAPIGAESDESIKNS